MKFFKHTIFALLLIVCSSSLKAQYFNFSHGTETYESIYGSGNIWRDHQFGKHAFPIDFSIQGFGKIDSIRFGVSNFTLFSNSNTGEFICYINSRENGDHLPDISAIWFDTSLVVKENILIIEFRVKYPNFEERYGEYQVVFNQNSGKISYRYGKSGFDSRNDERFAIGLLKQGTEDNYLLILLDEASNPKIATKPEDLGYLNTYPAPNTYYDFTPSTSSIGDEELVNNTSIFQTENGFRIKNHSTAISAELLSADGKQLAIGQNFGSEYTFLIPNAIQKGMYLIRLIDKKGQRSATIKVMRK